MMRAILLLATCALCACLPQANKQDPRDRLGAPDGVVTWRAVAQVDGHAAFLSRPGSAPDLVLWCRDSREITLRAHVFVTSVPNPDLTLSTKGGTMVFTSVRRQGGVRAGDRILVEGTGPLDDPKIGPLLGGAGELALTSGTETYRANAADPNTILPGFVAACQSLGTTKTTIK
jgi:hypothetical protein